jgi:hypothetical protein
VGEDEDAAAAIARLEAALERIAASSALQDPKPHREDEAAAEAAARIDRLIAKVRAGLSNHNS